MHSARKFAGLTVDWRMVESHPEKGPFLSFVTEEIVTGKFRGEKKREKRRHFEK